MKAVRSTLGAVAAAVLLVSAPAVLDAHMKVEKTEPAADAVIAAAPPSISVVFSEAPDLKVSSLEIKGPSAATKLVQTHVMEKSLMATVQGDMPDGVYTVSWRGAGKDGHVQKGDFTFTVKRK